MSSSVSTVAEEDSVGKLNWTDLTGLAAGCTARDFTVSMTFRHLATVVEMATWSSPDELNVAVAGGVSVAVNKGDDEPMDEATGA